MNVQTASDPAPGSGHLEPLHDIPGALRLFRSAHSSKHQPGAIRLRNCRHHHRHRFCDCEPRDLDRLPMTLPFVVLKAASVVCIAIDVAASWVGTKHVISFDYDDPGKAFGLALVVVFARPFQNRPVHDPVRRGMADRFSSGLLSANKKERAKRTLLARSQNSGAPYSAACVFIPSRRGAVAIGSSERRDLPSKNAPCSIAKDLWKTSPSTWLEACKRDAVAAHGAHDAPADDDVLGDDPARNLSLLANDQRRTMNVALDLAIHLHLAPGEHIAGDSQIFPDNRWRHAVWSPEGWRFWCELSLARSRRRNRGSHRHQGGRHWGRLTANGFARGFRDRLFVDQNYSYRSLASY